MLALIRLNPGKGPRTLVAVTDHETAGIESAAVAVDVVEEDGRMG